MKAKEIQSAIVLDDSDTARRQTARRLKRAGFEVADVPSVARFWKLWKPGMFDLIVADWNLSASEKGDHVLERVRKQDWEVPFVLISGKLHEDHQKADVLARLLDSGRARFVVRGEPNSNAIEDVARSAIELQSRRDIVLLRLIRQFRDAASKKKKVRTSSGSVEIASMLTELLAEPENREVLEAPLANEFVAWINSN